MNMNEEMPPIAHSKAPPRLGLAIASLVLGILAFLGSVIVIGALFGLVGIILGIVHVVNRHGRNTMAWAGIMLSLIGIVASAGLGFFYVKHGQAMLAAMQSGSSEFASWKGVSSPDISITTLEGEIVKLSDLKGKRVILDFWATWCGPCVMEIPHFIQLQKEVSSDDLVIIGISKEDESTLKQFVKSKGVNYLIGKAADLPAPFSQIRGIPTTFFIDRNGVIQEVAVGYRDYGFLKAKATANDL